MLEYNAVKDMKNANDQLSTSKNAICKPSTATLTGKSLMKMLTSEMEETCIGKYLILEFTSDSAELIIWRRLS